MMSLFVTMLKMKKYCNKCNKYHDINYRCNPERIMKPKDTEARKFRAGWSWTKKSLEIRERDNFLCAYCRSTGKLVYKGLSVHHIIPLEEDIERGLDDDNLITLCDACHKAAEKGDISRIELIKIISGEHKEAF